ncbi:MAG: uracil-DNA glycosylase family protein [Ferruginibacter sp.]
MAVEFDKGPTAIMAKLLMKHPDYTPVKDFFWFNWGPVFYRGRLNKSAKVLCVASDPGPTERIGGRALIGNAGQRVQGFLSKIGITKSYVCLNGHVYALHPSHLSDGIKLLSDPVHLAWRNKVFDAATGPQLQAIVAFGDVAKKTVDLWTGKGGTPVLKTFHPSYRGDEDVLTADWNRVITELRAIVTVDSDGDNTLPLYGAKFVESDYSPIPRIDLPFGAPDFLGDEHWLRTSSRSMNSVSRPKDDNFTLTWKAPQP